jgi:glycosyltransferase involved in cell wall biosynthesis
MDGQAVMPLRILHVISGLDPQNGGPTTALIGMAQSQLATGLDVSILATWKIRDGLPVADDLRAHGVKVIHIGPATGKLSRHPTLATETERGVAACDVVHIHGLWEEVQHQAARAAQRRGVPYVITPHGMLSPWNLAQSKWGKKLFLLWRVRRNLDRAAAIHYTCDVERDLVAPLKIKAKPIVERLGLDLSEFRDLPPRGSFRAKWPQLGADPFILFLGRIDYKKGLNVLIPAFAAADLPRTRLVIAGPDRDGYESTVRALVGDHALQDRVLFTGMLKGRDRLEAYVDASLFALTSHQENFGITVIEAMACGCPVLISDQVNIHSEVTQSGGGEVVALDVQATSRGLERWMGDEGMRALAGAKGRTYVMESYGWESNAREWCKHYEAMITA